MTCDRILVENMRNWPTNNNRNLKENMFAKMLKIVKDQITEDLSLSLSLSLSHASIFVRFSKNKSHPLFNVGL